MRIFHILPTGVSESAELDALTRAGLPEQGFVWVACARHEFEAMQAPIQSMLQALCGLQLVELHISDLMNSQLPSHYDYTSQYDLLVFRRLAAGSRAGRRARRTVFRAGSPAADRRTPRRRDRHPCRRD